jgi:hypothetical protein
MISVASSYSPSGTLDSYFYSRKGKLRSTRVVVLHKFFVFSPFRVKNLRLDPQKFYLHVWTRRSAPQAVAPSFVTWQSRVAPSSAPQILAPS